MYLNKINKVQKKKKADSAWSKICKYTFEDTCWIHMFSRYTKNRNVLDIMHIFIDSCYKCITIYIFGLLAICGTKDCKYGGNQGYLGIFDIFMQSWAHKNPWDGVEQSNHFIGLLPVPVCHIWRHVTCDAPYNSENLHVFALGTPTVGDSHSRWNYFSLLKMKCLLYTWQSENVQLVHSKNFIFKGHQTLW